MSVPILYVFQGRQPYLDLSVRQTRKWNPDSPIYHITNNLSAVSPGATGTLDADYMSMASRFAKSYEHMSTHSLGFELFCFQRWMVAYELMCDLGLSRAVLMDGDVLLWANMEESFRLYGDRAICWTEPDQPGTVLVSDRSALRELCDHMLWHYENPEGLEKLRRRHEERKAAGCPASICDMTLLGYFKSAFPELVGDTGEIRGGGRFDHNMNVGDGYLMDQGLKTFQWIDGIPYGYPANGGDPAKFFSMHFVGQAKGYMSLYAKERNLTSWTKVCSTPSWVRARVPAAIRKAKEVVRRRMAYH